MTPDTTFADDPANASPTNASPNSAGRPSSFYVTGGTVPTDAPSYVERSADRDLFDALLAGEYCFVLNARQMGKSSLCVRTVERLRAAGARTVFLDLQRLGGTNVTAEQWYAGMVAEAGRQLNLRRECLAYYKGNVALPPVARLTGTLVDVCLADTASAGPPHCAPHNDAPLVVFVDEVDAVRSLPFSADEFFSAIRELYNRRVREPQMARLVFCLIGSATPADLIADSRVSPFNVGRRIELKDFTPDEARPLAKGLIGGKALLARILHWTGGHPYLTQSLCAEATERGATTTAALDALTAGLFFEPRARGRNPNLVDVANRLLQPREGTPEEAHRAAILTLYGGLLRSRNGIPDEETDPLAAQLKLSGIVREEAGRLFARNRIYARIFGREWVRDSLPGAELRRQKEAAAKARWQVGMIASVVLAGMGALTFWSLRSAARAERFLYYASMKSAQLSYATGSFAELERALERTKDNPARGWEWGYWRRRAHQEVATVTTYAATVTTAAVSPDGKFILSADKSGLLRLNNARTLQIVYEKQLPRDMKLPSLAFAPDGKRFIVGGGSDTEVRQSGVAEIRDVATGERTAGVSRLTGCRGGLLNVQYFPDGTRVCAAAFLNGVHVWDASTGREIALPHPILPSSGGYVTVSNDSRLIGTVANVVTKESLASFDTALFDARTGLNKWYVKGTGNIRVRFSPDGRFLVLGISEANARVLDARNGHTLFELEHRTVCAIAFSPDSKRVATGGRDGLIRIWDLATRHATLLSGHDGAVFSLEFCDGGTRLLSCGLDGTVRLWDLGRYQSEERVPGKGGIGGVAFSPAANKLFIGCTSGMVKVHDLAGGRDVQFDAHPSRILRIVVSKDGSRYATGSVDQTAAIWDARTNRRVMTLHHDEEVTNLAFAPDGKTLLTVTGAYSGNRSNGSIRLWDLATRRYRAVAHPRRPSPVVLRRRVLSRRHPIRCWRKRENRVGL